MASMQCNGVMAPRALSISNACIKSAMLLVTTVSNAFIVLVVIKDPLKKLRTPFNYFVVNLAFADLIIGTITLPFGVYAMVLESIDKLDDVTAKISHMTIFISVTASILCLIGISVDRYIAITYPLKYRSYMNWRNCRIISAVIWLISLSLPFLYLKIGFIDYLMVFANSGIILTLVIFVSTYLRIFKFLRKQTRDIKIHIRTTSTAAQEFELKRLAQEKKVTRVFLLMLVLFLCTYGPATVMIYVLQYCKTCHCTFRHWLRDIEYLLIASNSAMNPFLYTIRLKQFRRSLKYLGKKWWKSLRGKIYSDKFGITISNPNVQTINCEI